MSEERQLLLPLSGDAGYSTVENANLWLICTSSENLDQIQRDFEPSSHQHHYRSLFLSVRNGSIPIKGNDIILLRGERNSYIHIVAPKQYVYPDGGRRLRQHIASALRSPASLRPLSSSAQEIMYVRFAGPGPYHENIDHHVGPLERALSSFQNKRGRSDLFFVDQYCRTLLNRAPQGVSWAVRAILNRLLADAMVSIKRLPDFEERNDWAEIIEAYRSAEREFSRGRFERHALECRRRGKAIAEPYIPNLIDVSDEVLGKSFGLGYKAVNCLGFNLGSPIPIEMTLPALTDFGFEFLSAPSIKVTDKALVEILQGTSAPIVAPRAVATTSKRDRTMYDIAVTIDHQHAIWMGLAGRIKQGRNQAPILVSLESDSCEVTPRSGVIRLGDRIVFKARPIDGGLHKVFVSASSEEFGIEPFELSLY